MVRRQIELWEGPATVGSDSGDHDPASAALADWDAAGVLTAPRGVRVHATELPAVIGRWRQDFTDLKIELTTLVSSQDEQWLAIEWTWHVTRRSDHARSSTRDAIIVTLAHGKIVGWREYFDTHGSVEFS